MKHALTRLILLLALFAGAQAAVAQPPNILLILADDMGWGDLGCHGNDKLATPALDALQRQSVELEHFYVSPVCSPTRASLLTGRHRLRLRVLNTTSGLEAMHGEEVTLAEALKPAGYVSGCFGKWHNGANHPSTARGQGFDTFFGFVGGFFSNYFDPELEHDGVTAVRKGFITDVLADAAMAFIEKHRAQPFFCYVPFNAPHSPMQAPEDLFAKYSALGFEPKTAAVYAMIENLDANVGRILARLDALGLADNTIVMFASDNGPNTPRFNGGMRGRKGSLFEGGQRVPCFIRWPGKLDAGMRVSQIARHVDVLPTLLDLAGVPLPQTPPLDGMSLAPLLKGEKVKWPERLLFEVTGRGGKDGTLIPKYPGTVRSDTHRWVHDNKQQMLFDLRNDPGEKNNIAAQQPEIAATLSKAYDAWFAEAIASTQGKVQRFPITLREDTELLAPYAALEGGAKFFGKGWDNDWIVFPTPTAAAAWNLELPQGGNYEVTVMHTTREAGGKIQVTAEEQSIETTLATAHDPLEIPRPDLVPRWEVPDKAFAPLKLGTLTVSSGLQTLRISAAPGIEIQSVRLRRAEKKSAALRLPSILSDHMVLQCDQEVPVWGWSAPALTPAKAGIFAKPNLAAWCIVPFDAKKRGPEERAAMLKKLGITKFVYDYRAEHIPQWDDELEALKKNGIDLLGWWFPGVMNEQARQALELFQRHSVKPQLWVSGNGGPVRVKDEADQQARIAGEVERLAPICEAAAAQGLTVGLYNHGSWFGEPENQIAILEVLKSKGCTNIGIVYNLHHGHSHLDRLPKLLEAMKPHLLCLNLNGMDIAGDTKGRKILPLGVGTEDVKVLRQVRASGYSGPIGILNHTQEDAEGRLLDNLDGLAWLVPQLDDNPPGTKPKYRTWTETAESRPKPTASRPTVRAAAGVPSLDEAFGKALSGGLSLPGDAEYHTLPFTIECRAKLDSKDRFNILVACNPKSTDTHWELYTHAKRGTLALYLPGRGGDYDSKVDICDGKWHNLVASVSAEFVTLWVDGRMVLEKPTGQLPEIVRHAGVESFAIGRLVEGTLGCDGIIDDVRLSRGVMKPRPGNAPRERMDNTLGLWNFDDLDSLLTAPRAPAPAPFEPALAPLDRSQNRHWEAYVNRERVFDYYGKQALAFLSQHPLPDLIPAFPGVDGGQQGHWGNQNDQTTWKDGRWAASDHGSLFSGVFKGAGLTLPKGVLVRYDDLAAVFDPETLSFPVRWKGGFVRLNDARHGFMAGAPMDGEVVAKSDEKREGRYLGFYRHGEEVVFAYEAGGETHYLNARGDAPEKLASLTRGGPAQWPQWLETRGSVGSEKPFATDTLTIPFENPYGTLFFLTAHDFFEDGSAAVATMTGEVWLVRGIDETLGKLRWKRFATGLHQPLGMKIVEGKIHVLGRDQITRLHDLNGDDEADYYECVTNAMQSSPGGHDFVVGLERDAEGNWYFTSGNEGLCRIGKNGHPEVLATGFRNPNGLGISKDGRFLTTSGQEGDWTPATSLFQVELGVNEGAHFGAGGPKDGEAPEPVLLYLPRGEDNSASSQAFVSGEAWGPLEGEDNLVHLSSGGGSAWLVMRERVKGRWQAAATKISGNFDSGPQCARFSKKDGALYVTGLQGWGTYTPLDGCFQRVRFTGGAPVPVGFEARENGVIVRFDQPVSESASLAAETFAQCWSYKYSGTYGSPEYSVRYPDTPGHDPLEVRSVQRLEGGKALFLEIPQIVPAGQVHLRLGTGRDLFLTVHELGEPYTDFAGYTMVPKTMHAAQVGVVAPVASKPNPWAGGAKGREIAVEAGLGLQYVQKEIRAKAGERISLRFVNPDLVPHNWLLAKPGTLQKMGELCNLMIADPEGLARHYVPESDEVLVWTDMVNPKADFTIHFDAPKEPGDYPYLCTFPGHWMVMNGVMRVE